MGLLDRLRRSFATPDPEAVSRRQFVAGAGVAAGAMMLPAYASPAGPDLGIEPGTLVDAQGRPLDRPAQISEPFIGTIAMFGFNFPPRGWARCDGQLLPIRGYEALFSLLGTIYGGDGQTTFGLPDLRGRFPMHDGSGPGLSPRVQGTKSGQESVALTSLEMPAHTHGVPQAQVRGAGTQVTGVTTGGDQGLSATAAAGASQPHNNMPPFLAVNFCIALVGIFPSRN